MSDAIFYLLVLPIFLSAILFVPVFMTERAAIKVVTILRAHQAESMWNAKTPEELGLGPRSFTARLSDPRRDYKPIALKMLMSTGIVRKTGNGKLYLSEKALADFCFKNENRLKVCSLV